jgi:surface antigen
MEKVSTWIVCLSIFGFSIFASINTAKADFNINGVGNLGGINTIFNADLGKYIKRYMNGPADNDIVFIQNSLEHAKDGETVQWTNNKTKLVTSITNIKTYVTGDVYCRMFELRTTSTKGRPIRKRRSACRQYYGDVWRIN